MLESDFEGLRLLAARKYVFASRDPRLDAFVRKALKKGRVEPLSLLRSLGYDLEQEVQEARQQGLCELLHEGSVTVDFLGSRNSFRFSLLELATSSYAEKKVHQLCKQRTHLYKAKALKKRVSH